MSSGNNDVKRRDAALQPSLPTFDYYTAFLKEVTQKIYEIKEITDIVYTTIITSKYDIDDILDDISSKTDSWIVTKISTKIIENGDISYAWNDEDNNSLYEILTMIYRDNVTDINRYVKQSSPTDAFTAKVISIAKDINKTMRKPMSILNLRELLQKEQMNESVFRNITQDTMEQKAIQYGIKPHHAIKILHKLRTDALNNADNENKPSEKDWRNGLDIGSKCKIYSKIRRMWTEGQVTDVPEEKDDDRLTVQYSVNDITKSKLVRPNCIRPPWTDDHAAPALRKPRPTPLHRCNPQDICDHIENWVLNDMNHKTYLARTKDVFANRKLSGQKMIYLEPDDFKLIVQSALLQFITKHTLDIMFKFYDEWKSETQSPYEDIVSKTAEEMADILFHYPLNSLLERINNESIDGLRLIQSLANDQHDINAFHIIVAETGWDDNEVRQILSVLFRHHTWIQSEFAQNMDRVWAKEEYKTLPLRTISKIKDAILKHDVEEIHYKIKNAQSIDEFSDHIVNMVDMIIEDEQAISIKPIYQGIADCFIFYQESEDLILELQHWICNNCGNCNVNNMINSKQTRCISICILCGLPQQQQIVLKLKKQDTYMMVNNMTSVDADNHDTEVLELDDIDVMIKQTLCIDSGFNLQCPTQNNNLNCDAILRLTKILIKYKRWLYTLHTKTKGKDDIQRTVKVDIAKFISDDEYQSVFRQSLEAMGIIKPQDLQCIIESMDNIMHSVSNPTAFLQSDTETLVEIIQKHCDIQSNISGLGLRLRFAIKKGLKQKAISQGTDSQNIDDDILNQIITDYLKTMQTTSRALREALDNNKNDIASVYTFVSTTRKRFGKTIQKEGKISLAMSLKLHHTIARSLKQKAQTEQFGVFLSDLDMGSITQDYLHILKEHIREGDKTCIENCFRYFEYAVHFEDKAIEIEQCWSTSQLSDRPNSLQKDRMSSLNTDQRNNDVPNDPKDIQSQLDIMHSYLVHSKWRRFVQIYSKQSADTDLDIEHKCDDEEEEDHSNKFKFGIDHDHPHLKPVHSSIRDELLLNKQPLSVELFQDAIRKAITFHHIILNQNTYPLICKYYDSKYNIIRNQFIEMHHVFAIIAYTDYSNFCTMFRATFRTIGNETTEDVTHRHQQIYYYARSLLEAVEFFGNSMDSNLQVYLGLDRVLYFDQFTGNFNQPISATTDASAAYMFCLGRGMILVLTLAMEYLMDSNDQAKYLPISFLSCFPLENEYLFYGRHVALQISDIHTISEKTHLQSHSAELQVLNKLQKMVNSAQVTWNQNQLDMLLLLIKRRIDNDTNTISMTEISDYGIALFNYFCDQNHKITIYNFKQLPPTLQTVLFADISLDAIIKLFTNLTHLSLIELDIQSMISDSKNWMDDILNFIVCLQRNQSTSLHPLRKITLQSKKAKKRSHTKHNSILDKMVRKHERVYRKHRWDISYDVTFDVRYTLSFHTSKYNQTSADASESDEDINRKTEDILATFEQSEMKEYARTMQSNDDIGTMDRNKIIENENPIQSSQNEQAKEEIVESAQVTEPKNPKEWTEDEVVTWLCGLHGGIYARYKDAFIKNEFDGAEFDFLTESALKDPDYGVKKASHRSGIMKGVRKLLNNEDSADDDDRAEDDDTKDEMKTHSDIPGLHYNDALCKAIKSVDNALFVFFGITIYQSATYPNLDDLHEDETFFRNIFEKKFGYKFITNNYKKTWTKAQAKEWIENVRNTVLVREGGVRYNALIFCGASHGSVHSIICSDAKQLEVKDIRSFFAWNVNIKFGNLPKVFIFNCCRTKYVKPRAAEPETCAAGYAVSITGTEGDPVFGSRLSRYVASAFGQCYKTKGNMHQVLVKAAKIAKEEGGMDLRLQEHDINIDDVVFLRNPACRGGASGAQVDGTTQIRDDDLSNILEQRAGSMNLLAYLDALTTAGFTTNTKLRTLTAERLEQDDIKMKLFERLELLKRIAQLKL